jgi:type IV fimbrial biogenesis protein FimT
VIVITLSTPLSSMFQQNRVSTQVREFVGALNLARGTAISRGACTSLCISNGNNPPGCTAANFNGDALENWNQGWLVFTDANCNAQIDAGAPDNDTILKQFAGLPNNYHLIIESTNNGQGQGNNDRETITYQASGIANTSVGTWTLCTPSGDDALKRGIDISFSGRVQSLTVQQAVQQGVALADCPA